MFNVDIGSWDTSAVTRMNRMFFDASIFHQSLQSWDTSAVRSMTDMFAGASSFDANHVPPRSEESDTGLGEPGDYGVVYF